MIHPHCEVVVVGPQVGHGVVAIRDIPRGTILWTQDVLDQVFSPEALEGLPGPLRELLLRYAHRDREGRFILCWDGGRSVNHACEPTMRGVGSWFMVARRDLAAGEELTCDYAECNLLETLHCACGSPACRREVGPDDLLALGDDWDAEARELARTLSGVEQPLWPYLLDVEEATALAKGRIEPLPFARQHPSWAGGCGAARSQRAANSPGAGR